MRAGFVGVAVVVLLQACGGDEFSSSNGGAGSGGSAGAGATGGAGGSTGGSAGAGGSTGGTGGSTGGAGGSSGGAGGSTGGSAGAGGSLPNGCGNAHPSAMLLYTTFDSSAATITPEVIQNGVGEVNGGSFAEGYCDNAGFRADTTGAFASYPAPQNINLQSGTIDFFFRPFFDTADNQTHRILGVPGQFTVVKTDVTNSLIIGLGSNPVAEVAAANVPFVSGNWVRITIVWKLSDAQLFQIYFNGQAAPLANEMSGPVTPPALGDGEKLFIGAFSSNDTSFANGAFDDFKIYAGTEPP